MSLPLPTTVTRSVCHSVVVADDDVAVCFDDVDDGSFDYVDDGSLLL